jgi:hypothetical protein
LITPKPQAAGVPSGGALTQAASGPAGAGVGVGVGVGTRLAVLAGLLLVWTGAVGVGVSEPHDATTSTRVESPPTRHRFIVVDLI